MVLLGRQASETIPTGTAGVLLGSRQDGAIMIEAVRVLTQAQLNVTQAEVENLSAKYDYQIQYAALQYAVGLLR